MRRYTWPFALMVLVAILAAPASATYPLQAPDDGRIVPGHRIGPITLGMSRTTIESMALEHGCPVAAEYDESDRAIRVQTSTGGACAVNADIQVGVSAGAILATCRAPDEIVEDARYPHATAFWVTYVNWGIAFRVLVMQNRCSIIQAIAVFSGTATVSPCRAMCGSVAQFRW